MTMGDKLPGVGVEEEPLLPLGAGKSPNFNMGGGVKTAVISFIVTIAVLMLMTFAGGVSFVTKQDFATNMANVVATLEQAQADLVKTKSEVASAVQGIPGTVATYVNNAVSQATSQWSSQLSTLNSKIDSTNAKVDTSVASITSRLNDAEAKIAALQTQVVADEAIMTDNRARITALEAKLSTISTLASIYIVTPTRTYTSDSGIIQNIPLQLTNTSSTSTSVPMVLTITTDNVTVSRIRASIDGSYGAENPNTVGLPVTFNMSISAGANTTTYTSRDVKIWFYDSNGYAKNGITWVATWSKQ